MKVPVIEGLIERRILVNYRADAVVVQNILPKPFRPSLYNGYAIVGVCLIRLSHIKPKGMLLPCGISSENGAHRIAVEWTEHGVSKQGVYITRRDTSSLINSFAGGRFFPGKHYRAKFHVSESSERYKVSFISSDDTLFSIDATVSDTIDDDSIFANIENASEFFKAGSTGFSPTNNSLDGIRLETFDWNLRPLKVHTIHSTFFEDTGIFPTGSIAFDNALIMTNISHEWRAVEHELNEPEVNTVPGCTAC